MLPSTLLDYLATLLSTSWLTSGTQSASAGALTFHLRHLHASSGSDVLFRDFNHLPSQSRMDANASYLDALTLQTRRVKTYKSSARDIENARRRSIHSRESAVLDWVEDDAIAPNVESRDTLQLLAKMTYNAYMEPSDKEWYSIGKEWTGNQPVGWEPDADGFRGYVFSTEDNSTVVLSIKGTSAGLFGGGGPTARKDKLNDNLLFSCCCARVDWTWTTVCDCYSGGWKCDLSCLQKSLVEDSLFYPIGTNLYYNISYMYPTANIWIVGHSLGGSLASLLGSTFGTPVVAFEAPGERMASQRLHLPQPPSTQEHITHVYHTADPIAMGTCNGVFSSCFIGGYAMESRCHLGKSVIYDTMSNLSWSSDVRTHTIQTVIEKVLGEPWKEAEEKGREVPEAIVEEDCVECYSWEFENP